MKTIEKEKVKNDNMIYCEIQNNGEIDTNALRLMGATTKDGSKIGYFGSGIKYALATALRMNIPIKIFQGEKEIKISLRKTKMRGHNFSVICVNGAPTSITTQMGRDWKPWFIFREFYCNAIDEGGESLDIARTLTGMKNKTKVYIGLRDSIRDIFSNQDKYFSTKRNPLYFVGKNKLYSRIDKEMVVYRRGVRVFDLGSSLYDYDFYNLEINEAREASDFNIKWEMVDFWKNHATREMIASLINNPESLEFKMDWGFSSHTPMSSTWLECLENKVIVPQEYGGYFADDLSNYHIILPHKLCLELHKAFGDKLLIKGMLEHNTKIVEVPITQRAKDLLEEATNFLKQSYYFVNIENDFPIKVAILDKHVLGEVQDGAIFLSPDLFLKGKKEVIKVLVEEYVHAKSEAGDRTRSMQNNLIEIIVTTIEEKCGQYL